MKSVDKRALRSLMGLASVVEVRDPYTGGHLWRVGQFSKVLAEKIGMDKEEVFKVTTGAVLHDLGKVGVPDAVLRKPDKLTDDEYAVIKTHPTIGRELIEPHPLAELALDAIFSHHEHISGRGYPNNLQGDQIPLAARIVGITDAFDAMTSSRPYRNGMPIDKALSILVEEKGRQFDAKLVDLFVESHQKSDRISHIVGHSDHGNKLVCCPKCGPIIAISRYFKDGGVAVCRSCTMSFTLHKKGDSFEASVTDPINQANALCLRPQAEDPALTEFIEAAPKNRSLFWFGLGGRG